MHRCFIDPSQWNDEEMRLSADEQHHLRDVLRGKAGDTVLAFDGRGREAEARLAVRGGRGGTDAREITLQVLRGVSQAGPAVAITLIQALPKGTRMDWIVEKATELGVRAIVPAVTERVVARLSAGQRGERRERWRRVACGAAKQCGTAWIPDIMPVTEFGELGVFCRFDLFAVGSLAGDARPLRAVAGEWRSAGRLPGSVGILIGPEGDLTPQELGQAARMGAVPVSFGRRVLRVETAALYALSVLAYEFLNG
jgi:16S rRNA (uracil1498-N3)-methyltransferase